MLRTDTGEVRLNGVPVPTAERRRAQVRNKVFGYVPQDYAIVDNESAERNASIPLEYASPRVGRRDRRARTLAALDAVGLAWAARTKTARLSGGERQRVAIARALLNEPSVVLADEPSAALDGATAHEVVTLLLAVRERGAAVLIATHDPRIAERCDRVVRMADGRLT
jgi:ABC-type lipoprotein export system ATPase subunit